MKFWKVEIIVKNLADSDVNTEVYYSEKDTCLKAINESLDRFYDRHLEDHRNIVNISVVEEMSITRDYKLKYYMNVFGKLCPRTANEYNSLIVQDCRDNDESESAAKAIIKQKVKEAIVLGKSSYKLSYGFPLIIIKEYIDVE